MHFSPYARSIHGRKDCSMEIVAWVAKYLRNHAIFENTMLSMDPDSGNIFEEPSMNSTAQNQGSSTTYEESQGLRRKGIYLEL